MEPNFFTAESRDRLLGMKTLSAIVAYDRNRGIGSDNVLPWGQDLPTDICFFREIILGKSVIMGRKTYQSIGRLLTAKENIIVTRQNDFTLEGALVFHSLAEAITASNYDVMIIGGAEIYAQALPYVNRVYATEVHAKFPRIDAFFPELSQKDWHETSRRTIEENANDKHAFDFVIYDRLAA